MAKIQCLVAHFFLIGCTPMLMRFLRVNGPILSRSRKVLSMCTHTVISPRVAQKSLRFVWREGLRRSLYPEFLYYQEKIVKARVARGLEGEQEYAPHDWGGRFLYLLELN